MTSSYTVLIASYLEAEYVERIRALSDQITVIYEPDLLAPPRYPADHTSGVGFVRSPEDEARWRSLLAQADILFDFDHTNREALPELTPKLRWVQATSAGIGQMVRSLGYAKRMPSVQYSTASGTHSHPLAEFCAMAMMMFSRNLWQMQALQSQARWERFAASDLMGRTVTILGLGRIGRQVARVSAALDMRVLGVKRTVAGIEPSSLFCDALYSPDQLDELLPQSEFLVIITPHTDETEQMITARELALPKGAVLINIGRGAIIDETALIEALQSGHLAGAALDVFATEPLPSDSPLWSMPNVLVSPHSASTSDRENSRLVDLFCDNLQRFLNEQPLRNLLNTETLY
jgi:glyoxylate/hydroxypyruvate reductase A